MKVIGLVIARMGSSRRPGKSLAPVGGKPLVTRIIERMQGSGLFDEVVLASPDTPQDKLLLDAGAAAGATPFAGANEDVLDRLYQAAKSANADEVVHIGGDCPFPDHEIMAHALDLLREDGTEFVSNIERLTFPAGMDTDAIRFEALERMWQRADLVTHRVHCLSYIHHFPSQFKTRSFTCDQPLGHMRWTVDYPEDVAFADAVYSALGQNDAYFSMRDILDLLRRQPAIANLNAHLTTFVEGQPAYWDSEGYMSDIRDDTLRIVSKALQSDRSGDLTVASEQYQLAEKLLNELAERARQLAGQKPDI